MVMMPSLPMKRKPGLLARAVHEIHAQREIERRIAARSG